MPNSFPRPLLRCILRRLSLLFLCFSSFITSCFALEVWFRLIYFLVTPTFELTCLLLDTSVFFALSESFMSFLRFTSEPTTLPLQVVFRRIYTYTFLIMLSWCRYMHSRAREILRARRCVSTLHSVQLPLFIILLRHNWHIYWTPAKM